jgi:hypothetical protein
MLTVDSQTIIQQKTKKKQTRRKKLKITSIDHLMININKKKKQEVEEESILLCLISKLKGIDAEI